MNFDEYATDDRTTSAVQHKLGVIHSAAKDLHLVMREKYRTVPWADLITIREKVIGPSYNVDHDRVWKFIQTALPNMKPVVRQILEELRA